MWINWACLVYLVSSSTMSCYSLQKNGPGAPGGQSWTVEWLRFDNSYFKVRAFCHILHAEKIIRVHHLLSGSNTSGYQRETRSGSSGPTYRCCFIWGPKVQGDLWWSTVWCWYSMNLIVELTLLYENPQHNQVYAEKYAEDQDAFFRDYAEAHAKLSELGAKFQPPQVSVNISVLSFPSSTLWFSLKWQFNWLWVGN